VLAICSLGMSWEAELGPRLLPGVNATRGKGPWRCGVPGDLKAEGTYAGERRRTHGRREEGERALGWREGHGRSNLGYTNLGMGPGRFQDRDASLARSLMHMQSVQG
jgi:hypothetical protein